MADQYKKKKNIQVSTVQVQIQVQRKRKLHALKKANRFFTDAIESTLFNFNMHSGIWGLKARLQILLIAKGVVGTNVTQIPKIKTWKATSSSNFSFQLQKNCNYNVNV